MVTDPKQVTAHEAGHAVMQWFVGWESKLDKIQMSPVDGRATDGIMIAKSPELDTLSAIRSRLLVLLAGHVAANTRSKTYICDLDKDYCLAAKAVGRFLKVDAVLKDPPSITRQFASGVHWAGQFK